MLIHSVKVNKCKYSASPAKMQAVKKSKKYLLNQQDINFIEIGMDIAVTKKEDFQVNMDFYEKDRAAKIIATIICGATLSLWRGYYTF